MMPEIELGITGAIGLKSQFWLVHDVALRVQTILHRE
jgi:hypothetical protein